jgi:phenylpyruvate tautomerase PptA (4-oxalocrotonate tautomerase family)
MPWVQVNILDDQEQSVIEELMRVLTIETARVLRVPESIVRVVINEYSPSKWAVGGAPIVPVYLDPPETEESGEH